MNTTNNQKVYSVNGRLQAIWVESILLQAGVPVSFVVSKSGDYLDVIVPAENVYDANNILHPERHSKAICSVFSGM
jgi:hypothetical protein